MPWLPGITPITAYIGPGAGFALGGSFLFALAGMLLAVVAVLAWPARVLIRNLRGQSRRRKGRRRKSKRGRGAPHQAVAKRVVVLGLDGFDPVISKRLLDAGQLPNLARIRDEGTFRPLISTYPAMSPVGWSTFATGVDPSGHNIFDFLSRDLVTHLPILSSTRLHRRPVRKLGPLALPGGGPRFELLRRSKPFWKTCAEAGVASSILRVPITFPPDRFGGKQLSAMCVPDLRGTQGTFSHYTSAQARGRKIAGRTTGGVRLELAEQASGVYTSVLTGPDLPGGGRMTLPITAKVDREARRAAFTVGPETVTIGENEYSDWIPLVFKGGGGTAHGIVKVRITSLEPDFSFYVTPVNIDPRHPAMPISNPPHLAMALSRLHGRYATLGLAEDTWALNERVIDEQAFLDQAYAIHEERKRQFFHALDRQPDGVVSVVFDATDRIQHMFFRYLDPDHPANAGKDTEQHKEAIDDLYRRADTLVGQTLDKLGPRDALLVISDHGFKTFRRGVNLNTWFRDNGYLFLKSDPTENDPTQSPLPPIGEGERHEVGDIDWQRTRAYTSGLAGYYLNLKGREREGCVDPTEADALLAEINAKLRGLPDTERGETAITEVWTGREIYHGPYRTNGPDAIVGYKPGYRADWDAAVGAVGRHVISDNTRSWSGDHCMDPRAVPGVIFSTRPFRNPKPALVDMAPTVLDLLGLDAPGHMTGRSVFAESEVNP
ncbi:nucleotide pyrophosphatase [bacterium DOLJORAL78_65_58]|nr:MAG: nucleotide pyrophosphatase [bacterium DOLZORAL124_64_63]PIE75670.1 MAG: nucleotide pyrophosphatase [bacterium DOLJORAL78_65_58]